MEDYVEEIKKEDKKEKKELYTRSYKINSIEYDMIF